ncbi:hypothetical protein NKH77_10135 [Streptomyces sp. M19]
MVCPGAWAPEVLTGIGVPFTIERQIMYWFRPEGGTGPFTPDRHPVYIWEDRDAVQIYGFPAIDGPEGGAKVAFFRKGTVCTPETIDRTVHDEEVAAMAAQCAPGCPPCPAPSSRASPACTPRRPTSTS